MKKFWPFTIFAGNKLTDVAYWLISFLFILLCTLSISLVVSARLHANDGPALIQEAEISRLAKLLASKAADSGMLDDVCRLYLADREGVRDAFVARQSFVALSDAISGELNKSKPESGCEVLVMETTGQLSRDQISEYPQTLNRPGSVFALAIFPSRDGVMMFANGYRTDGRSVIYTDRIDVAVETGSKLDSTDGEGLGGPAQPVRQQKQADHSQSPVDEGDREVQLDRNGKSFLDRLRERVGTERAE